MIVRVGCMGCCVSSYTFVSKISRSGLTGVVENVVLGDLHPHSVSAR